jgi:transcriptional regulator with XRE-family HTH domain
VNRIKEFRNQKGWTQSELADRAGLSLRTIQRIESGQSLPQGHTLQVLSELIGVNPAEFKSKESEIRSEHLERLKLINLSALAVIVIPFGNILLPFMLWKRSREDRVINQVAKYILNFQIIWSLLLSLLLILSPFIQNSLQLAFSLIVVVLVLSYCFNVWIIFKFSRWINKGDFERMKLTFQLL